MALEEQPPAEEVRHQMRERWGKAAGGWRERRAAGGRPSEDVVTDTLLALAGIAPGQRVLDMACGAGNPAFAIAERVGPAGSVLGCDITPAMVETCREQAREQGVANASFRLIEREVDLDVTAASFDAVTCRQALMFMPDPVAALDCWRRALKPGGHAAVSTWGPAERCHFFNFPRQVLSRHLEVPVGERPGVGVNALTSPEALTDVLTAAGFVDVRTTVLEVPMMEVESPEAWWERVEAGRGPGADLLAGLSVERRRAAHEDAIARLRELFADGPVRLTNEAVVAAGTNPADVGREGVDAR